MSSVNCKLYGVCLPLSFRERAFNFGTLRYAKQCDWIYISFSQLKFSKRGMHTIFFNWWKVATLKLLSLIIGNSCIISSALDGAYTDPKWNSRRMFHAYFFFTLLWDVNHNEFLLKKYKWACKNLFGKVHDGIW